VWAGGVLFLEAIIDVVEEYELGKEMRIVMMQAIRFRFSSFVIAIVKFPVTTTTASGF